MKQKMTVPSYMANFKCIAGDCEETCCAGCYIAIDEETYKKYKKVKHPEMKKRLDKELVVKKGSSLECAAKIKLKNNRCAFLAKDNLCDIYKNLGEHYLSETCTMYPRNTNVLGEKVELSLALSCPEAARQILLGKEAIKFGEEESAALPIVGARLKLQIHSPKYFEDYILKIRELLIAIWQESSFNMQDKWQAFEYVMMKFDEFKARQDIKKLDSFLQKMQNEGVTKYNQEFIGQGLNRNRKKLLIEEYTTQEVAKKLFVSLIEMRNQKKWPSARYEACYQLMVEGLGEGFNQTSYQKGEKIFEKALYESYPYILDNYFVNYIYERLVPINQKTPKESLEEMCLYFALIRLHLIGQGTKKSELREEDVVTLIQSFTRVFDHNELYIKQIKKQLVSK